MIACGPWQAPLPLQKPSCVTANCHKKNNPLLRISQSQGTEMYVRHLLVKNVTNRQRKNAKGQKWSHKPDRKKNSIIKKRKAMACAC